MILRFFYGSPNWIADPDHANGLIIQASRIAGSKAKFRRLLTGPASLDPFWLVMPRRADEGCMAADEPMYSTIHLRAGHPSFRVTLHEPDHPNDPWSVTVNSEARLLLPKFDPTWQGDGL